METSIGWPFIYFEDNISLVGKSMENMMELDMVTIIHDKKKQYLIQFGPWLIRILFTINHWLIRISF